MQAALPPDVFGSIFSGFLKTFPSGYNDWAVEYLKQVKRLVETELETAKKTVSDAIETRHDESVKKIKESGILSELQKLDIVEKLNQYMIRSVKGLDFEMHRLTEILHAMESDLLRFENAVNYANYIIYHTVACKQIDVQNHVLIIGARTEKVLKDFEWKLNNLN